MSASSLPEWKQLLLERKRREEEERERREKQEEAKFASMPAWKRGIIQRRKAKQDTDKEKEKEVCPLHVDGRPPSEGLSDTDSCLTNYWESELSTSPDFGQWVDAEVKPAGEVSVETIVPVRENPFIRTQISWKKGRNAELGHVQDVKTREKEKLSPWNLDVRARDIESKIERFRDLREGRQIERDRDKRQGREQENSRGRWEKGKNQWRELVKGGARDWDFLKVRKGEEDKESTSLSPHVPCLRTIRADNIIIIEQDRDERRGRQRDVEEKNEEDHQEKSGVKMGLREIFGVGGSVTEIRASEVLIIKPPEGLEETNAMGRGTKSREDGEMKVGTEGRWESPGREFRSDLFWLREKEKPWGQATVIKEDRQDSLEDNVFIDRGGRVSQLLSKFGEHPKPPSRSKSSDNFIRPVRRNYSDEDDHQSGAHGRNMLFKGVPKRSFSFSDRVISAEENGLGHDDCDERKKHDRIRSDGYVAPWINTASMGNEPASRVGCVRLLDKERFGKCRERQDRERSRHADEDEGFTVASVKNTEGISFARRVAIRHDGRARADGEAKAPTGERKTSIEGQGRDKKASSEGKDEGFESNASPDVRRSQIIAMSGELCSAESAFTDCSNLPPSGPSSSHDPRGELGWDSTGPQSCCALSQQTEELISKIEKIGDPSGYSNRRKRRILTGSLEKREVHTCGEAAPEHHLCDVVPRSPKSTEFQIPRAVFYVAEEMEKRPNNQAQEQEEQEGAERRDSWRIGKPLSRIESLREKIRQRELETLRQGQTQDGGEGESAEIKVSCQADRGGDDGGAEKEKELAAEVHMAAGAESSPEEAAGATTVTASDVMEEVDMLKSCPQLPGSVPHSQADKGEEEPSGETAAAAVAAAADEEEEEVCCDSFQLSEDEDDLSRHEGGPLNSRWARGGSREEREEEETESSEEELENVSPPHPDSPAAMSRIYNLNTVGSRSGLCLRERPVEVPSVHLVKVKPLLSNAQHGDGKAFSGEDTSGVQRQIEQFQLKEQEALRPGSRTGGPQSSTEMLNHQEKGNTKTQEEDEETSCTTVAPTSVLKQCNQTISITPSILRGQSLDNTLRPSDCTQTPASSPSSLSPAPSPSVSPSPSPSPTLFSIRSASGGKVKRGATITICPRKAAAGTEGGCLATGSVAAAEIAPSVAPAQQAQASPTAAEPAKKKYPTVEEIEVIGGYQNLEKSCLVKNKVMVKRVSRYFCLKLNDFTLVYVSWIFTGLLDLTRGGPEGKRLVSPAGQSQPVRQNLLSL